MDITLEEGAKIEAKAAHSDTVVVQLGDQNFSMTTGQAQELWDAVDTALESCEEVKGYEEDEEDEEEYYDE